MSWTVKASGGQGGVGTEKAPSGNHPAVLVGLIDLGTQLVPGFQGEPDKYQRRIYYVYELVTKKVTGVGRNHTVAIDLTFSFHEKSKMRKWVEARTGRKVGDNTEYDITQELGRPVLLNVVENKNGYPKIEGVTAIPDGLPVPPPGYKPTAWKLGDDMGLIPDWLPYLYGRPIPDVIRDSKEMKGGPVGGQPEAPPQASATSPAAPPRPPRPGARPSVVATEPAPGSVWWVYDAGQSDYAPLTAKEIEEWYQDAKLDPTTIRLYPDGGSEAQAKSARDYGFPALSPF